MGGMPGGMGGMGGMGGGMGGAGAGGMGGMFGGPEAEAKLKANPRIAKYFEDPKFVSMWQMCSQNPQMLMQVIQTDPRFMDVFKELTGIDLMDVQEKEAKKKDEDKDTKKKRDEENKKRKEAEEIARKEAEEASLPQEEREKIQKQKAADAFKLQGNDFYKKKQFEEALEFYQKAIDTIPDLTYFSNKAAVYFEMKKFDDCIAVCDEGIEAIKGSNYDFVKLSKTIARKANALLQLKKYDESIEMYQKALLENQDHGIKMALQKAQKTKKDEEALAYINPEIAEQHRQKGNELFKEAKYPLALKEYDEGLKRDPNAVAIYSNRCATWIKLMEFNTALKDADKCLEINPKFVKAYSRKGTCHHFMKEYHKALKAFDDGLKLDPANRECTEGKQKTMMTI